MVGGRPGGNENTIIEILRIFPSPEKLDLRFAGKPTYGLSLSMEAEVLHQIH